MVAHLYVDPEGEPGRELQRTLFLQREPRLDSAPRLADLPARLRAGFESPHRSDQSLIDLGRALLTKLAPGSERDERPEAPRAENVRLGGRAARHAREPGGRR